MSHQYNLRKSRKPTDRLIETMDRETEEINNDDLNESIINSNSNSNNENEQNPSRPISPQNLNNKTMFDLMQELKDDLKNNFEDQITSLKDKMRETMEGQNHDMQNCIEKQMQILESRLENNTTELINNLESRLMDKVANLKYEINEKMVEMKEDIVNKVEKRIQMVQTDIRDEITANRDEFNDRLDRLNEIHQKELRDLENKIKQLELKQNNEVINQQEVMGFYRVPINDNSLSWDNNIPKFNKNTNPMEFIQAMVDFLNHLKIRRRKDGSLYLTDLHSLINNMMEGTAKQWWQVIKSDIESLDEFKERFLEKYWNDEIQSEIKRKLENGKYVVGGRLTRTEYFIEKVLLMKNLTPRLTEAEIVKQLSNHFDGLIRDAVKVQKIRLIKDMENILNQEDLDDRNNISRRQNYDRKEKRIDRYRTGENKHRNYDRFHENEPPYRHENYSKRQNYNGGSHEKHNENNTPARQNPKN